LPEQKKNIIELEILLNKFFLDSAALLSHQHPLSIYIILGYMISKDNEHRILNIIIKGKQLNVDENFIREQLVID
jgi:V/A-type H+-transporting ATPase subunit C